MATQRQPRLVTRDGRAAGIVRLGLARGRFDDAYHWLLTASWLRLIGIIVAIYATVNILFACLYLAGGDCIENARPGSFVDAYFFSVQTMATIGYGKMVPKTVFANSIVAVEALIGMLFVAMATGLLFAKFSRPTARVLFSRVAVITRRDGKPTLMFRLANTRGNQIVEATLRVVLARQERTQEGEEIRRFHDVKLVRNTISFFALSWTVMHVVDEHSPLAGADASSLSSSASELIISLTGLDETFSQTVHARHSYLAEELVWDARFIDILKRDGGKLIVDYARFHDVETVPAALALKPAQ